ncbi:aminoacyl-histidine dipeptidase [Phaeocystidibacter marisrubri]|uniref:Cytosol non-specific dipeptidase n=1 Tax=Phaeocystidibacter marisrubri TaxID=1577780 RepID=A0A6L3ZJE1_9FLAO|nr:aminoacyl-histidine dipeptidase [Phaeocystidibacter marisrubri]KAB2817937.1 aminoacyl-histidine dipeptidase [Phaeocystidibacter marisrubri]GGH72774.1 aminoacyl-histidine dipeptidase [Phaeocystidibacter marisrubri]
MSQITSLEPAEVWKQFAALNAVPRPSKKEEQVIAFMMEFGKSLGLETEKDEVGNVLIRKPASAGMEDRRVVVLQSHLDMVCQQNAGTNHDFETEGIDMYVDGDWVKARGTTLGADNGMGVAAIMALLESKTIQHPPLEAIFTIDEETGMTGAQELRQNWLEGKLLLNLDTEDDDELSIGCAGGVDITATWKYATEAVSKGMAGRVLTVRGLNGGHSGMDIHKGLGNANKILNRVLFRLNEVADVRVVSIDGGSLRNAIPREAFAKVAIVGTDEGVITTALKSAMDDILPEYKTTDPNLSIEWAEGEASERMMTREDQVKMMNAIYAVPNGIHRMSPDIEDLVQTSNNLARVEVKEGEGKILCLTRSSVDTEKMDHANGIKAALQLVGADVVFSGSYPGWTPDPSSQILKTMRALYAELYGEEANVLACHAGLECGLLGDRYPGMEMISFGPNIRGAHSPDEKVQISSVQKFWGFLLETLKRVEKA